MHEIPFIIKEFFSRKMSNAVFENLQTKCITNVNNTHWCEIRKFI